jgi:DNA-binding IclR family transcriptional regulator
VKSGGRFDRWVGFIAYVTSRRAPTPVQQVVEDTGFSRAQVYRLVEMMQQHFPVELKDGLVSMRRKVDLQART